MKGLNIQFEHHSLEFSIYQQLWPITVKFLDFTDYQLLRKNCQPMMLVEPILTKLYLTEWLYLFPYSMIER